MATSMSIDWFLHNNVSRMKLLHTLHSHDKQTTIEIKFFYGNLFINKMLFSLSSCGFTNSKSLLDLD